MLCLWGSSVKTKTCYMKMNMFWGHCINTWYPVLPSAHCRLKLLFLAHRMETRRAVVAICLKVRRVVHSEMFLCPPQLYVVMSHCSFSVSSNQSDHPPLDLSHRRGVSVRRTAAHWMCSQKISSSRNTQTSSSYTDNHWDLIFFPHSDGFCEHHLKMETC